MGPPLSAEGISTKADSVSAITKIDAALLDVANYRADLGATSNRLMHTVDNLMNRVENTSSARSQIEDADFASESASLAKSQVLQQAGTAMLAQANASGQGVMSLLK
jgi:flagellin